MIIVFLNLDEVIRIIREEDEPKAALIARFTLTEAQANYMLDTRLRSLRRLEEMALRKEQDDLNKEKGEIEALLASEKKQWQVIACRSATSRRNTGRRRKIGKRRTTLRGAARRRRRPRGNASIEREPVTVVVSQKGWIRALKGHVADLSDVDLQGRRRAEDIVLRRDDVEDSGAGERRQGVHARRRETAGRALAWASRSG